MTSRASRRLAVVSGLVALGLLGGAAAWAGTLSLTSKRLTVYRTCFLSASAATSTALFDAWVDQANASTVTSPVSISVGAGSTANHRAYLRFAVTQCLPAMPATATVRSATIRMYGATQPGGCRTEDLYTVPSAWDEATITWNNQPFGTTLNNPPQAQRKSTTDIGTGGGCQNTTGGYGSGWDVTSDVQAIVAGTATNNGWMIRDAAEGNNPARAETYLSKNSNGMGFAPELLVTWS